ncbi:MAG: efflux RND transporter periplasmic adaptor subunit [Desulfomonile tiedjei]|nr:efflux RND transporter periplasmic adaptor subunit [Desulfomonile tiedjei]
MNEPYSRARLSKQAISRLLVVALILLSFSLGYYLSGHKGPAEHAGPPQASVEKGPQLESDAVKKAALPTIWTCSMHPQIKLPKAGKCPICFMDLIPLDSAKSGDHDHGPTRYEMSEAAKRLAEVTTSEAKREPVRVKVRMFGMVTEDETRIAALTARIDGRLDEIFVNFTGDRVNKGDPMVTIWSPTLIKSQVELFESERGPAFDPSVLKGAEEKLIQYGLTREQVEDIKQKKQPINSITLKAPISGVVTKRMAFLGQFVKEGQDMYTINDLSHVWVKMDAYETDMPWVRYGQEIVFSTPAIPGRTFKGSVLFIDPMLDTKTRSVKIRAEAENPHFVLKPGMFVTAELEAEVDKAGRVIRRKWAGKYICPVHPKDEPSSEPGICPESKLPMKPATSYGYTDDPNPELPLVIPASAPLITGKRSIVYVEVPGTRQPTYELREVVLGPRAGDKYVVYEGLKEGERVVTYGNFKIDSAMQILARPSMMAPPEETAKTQAEPAKEEEAIERIQVPKEFLAELTPVAKEYAKLKDALVEDKPEEAARYAGNVKHLLKGVNSYFLDEKGKLAWSELYQSMTASLNTLESQQGIAEARKAFDSFSEAFAKALMTFRHLAEGPLFLYHCPMVSDGRGAYWIEESRDYTNPYFGRKQLKGQDMLKCGELVEQIPSDAIAGTEAKADAGSQPKDASPSEKQPEGAK